MGEGSLPVTSLSQDGRFVRVGRGEREEADMAQLDRFWETSNSE